LNSQTQDAEDAASRASLTDRDVLEGGRRDRRAENLRPLLQRYGAFVYSSAYRRTGDGEAACEVTRAVFLVLFRRAQRLRKAVLAGWLFQVTAVACSRRIGRLRRLWHWISRRARPSQPPADCSLWMRAGSKIDRALGRLSSGQRNAVLLCSFLNHDLASGARILRIREARVHKRIQSGMKKLAKQLHKRLAPIASGELVSVCATEGCSGILSEPLTVEILRATDESETRTGCLRASYAFEYAEARCFTVFTTVAGLEAFHGLSTTHPQPNSGATSNIHQQFIRNMLVVKVAGVAKWQTLRT
jgi:DNA-directed RNA polymerase specialized sigma24 family protein